MPKKKNLEVLKEWILEQLAEGSKRWSELWSLGKFGSTRYLNACLDELENEDRIKRVRISHKNVKYVIAAHYEIWQKIKATDEKVEHEFEGLLPVIESIKDWSEERASQYIASIIASIILRFSLALEGTAKAIDAFKPIARHYLLERALDRWGRTLVACGKAHPNATDTALSAIRGQQLKTKMDMQRASHTQPPKGMEIEELGFDVGKAADDFKRLILAADEKIVGK